ncbi:MAG: S41 family peptidase, partial [Lewinella sp.]|nr:S41 family peptidase [Lewinella sp.]
ASASEIVSGVMQDYDRAVLMGQRSYGKGLVQNTRDLKYNAKVKMTIAKYYIPSQRCIQSVEYKNGEPVDISDDRRTAFKTRNGRTVLDGGGLAPDVLVEKPTERGILKSLIDENLVFDFVTRFCQANESIPSVENFHFTDFDGFLAFLNEKNYEYESDSEKALKTLEADASEEGLNLKSDIQQLRNKITSAKQDELTKYKSEIIDLIEKEISGRYYYQRGKVQMGLRNDLEIKEAAELLKDQARYKKILAIQ